MKTHSKIVIVGRAIRVWMWSMLILPGFLVPVAHGRTVCTSTGGTSGTPLNWKGSGTWSCSGSGAPRVYIIRSGDHIYFDTSNSSPYIDTVLVNGFLVMGNNVTMTFTSTGAIGLIGTNSTISGGSNNTVFAWNGSTANITGPFTAANIISNGPRYASASSTLAAGGNAQSSFIYGTLPMQVTSFYSYCSKDEVLIHWSTAMEINSERFDVMMSSDGKNWNIIGSTPAAGESFEPRNYAFRYIMERAGPSPQNTDDAENFYFQLKCMDKSKSYTLTPQILLQCKPQTQGMAAPISISPNPSIQDPLLEIEVLEPGIISIDVYTETGKLFKTYTVEGQFNEQILSVALRNLDPGIYRARVVSNNITKSTTFVKL